jgi:RecA/RadA recombinase
MLCVCIRLDDMLEGGLHCRKIYEICGASSSGKSQLCHWISLHATMNKLKVYYIDCSRNFSTSRIQMILESKQCSDIVNYFFIIIFFFNSR